MSDLFGIDIAGLVAETLSGQLITGSWVTRTFGSRTPGSLTEGRAPTEVTITFEGIFENIAKKYREEDTNIKVEDQAILMIVGSFSPAGYEPQPDDTIMLEGRTVRVYKILERDPASATFLVATRK